MVIQILEVLAAVFSKDIHLKKLVFNYPIDKAYFINKTEWKEKYKYEVIIGDGETVMERVFK